MSGLKLNREELLIILYEVESRLQEAIVEDIPSRIEFYTELGTKLHTEMREIALNGPVAQRSEQGTHNPLVAGSNPAGPTN